MSWPAYVEETAYPCTADDSRQPALLYAPTEAKGPLPLLVGLHTWSFDYTQGDGETVYARWCRQNGWLFIHPDFRGCNDRPSAMGSELAVSDIADAVEYMKATRSVDPDRIYLCGVSGGGHAAMLMAGRRPEIWAGVSAWCGISDVARWWEQTAAAGLGYSDMIESACGGEPLPGSCARAECGRRSPLSWLAGAGAVNLDINAGVHDGRSGSVPFSQSLYAFDAVAAGEDRMGAEVIEKFYQDRQAPAGNGVSSRELYGEHTPLFVKSSGNTRVTIFDGGHEIVHGAALNWLANQRKGTAAAWAVDKPIALETESAESASGT
jgi:pimeloyl-ACP methyl ester carboxylesterase